MPDPRVVFRVSTGEAAGPSGAGSRAGATRNPRRDAGIRLTTPRLGAAWNEIPEHEPTEDDA